MIVSWVMVYVRKSYFRRRFGDVIVQRMRNRAAKDGLSVPQELIKEVEAQAEGQWRYRISRLFRRPHRYEHKKKQSDGGSVSSSERPKVTVTTSKLSTQMVRRTDNAPRLVDPSGWISEGHANRVALSSPVDKPRQTTRIEEEGPDEAILVRRHTAANVLSRPHSPIRGYLPRSPTVEFAPNPPRHARRPSDWDATLNDFSSPLRRSMSRPAGFELPSRSPTHHTLRPSPTLPIPVKAKETNYGGFPGPLSLISRLIRRLSPNLGNSIYKKVTMPRTETLISQRGAGGVPLGETRTVPYITFDALVGRNSAFHDLTQEKLEELGGVEYRALSMLLWIIGGYHVITQLLLFAILVAIASKSEYHHVFTDQPKFVSPSWFAAFQAVSAYTNTGTSLVDTSMVPFRQATGMIIPMFIVIIAGNTGYPIFLRFVIWILTKIIPETSQTNETLHFLLDHPRRCYIYLFPSHQTWFLFTVLVLMCLTDWVSFMILDIGTPEVSMIPVAHRLAVGLLQAGAVRAAGFAAISLNALAPAVKVLYITMMYVAVYPIALSVRSTNVYEERSLGVFRPDNDEDVEDVAEEGEGQGRAKVWGKYLTMHARKQLAFDIWWLGFALWLVCIVERGQLVDDDNQSWFNIFTVRECPFSLSLPPSL